jgi:hypothetical protein
MSNPDLIGELLDLANQTAAQEKAAGNGQHVSQVLTETKVLEPEDEVVDSSRMLIVPQLWLWKIDSSKPLTGEARL